jgi:hypothetical protein
MIKNTFLRQNFATFATKFFEKKLPKATGGHLHTKPLKP